MTRKLTAFLLCLALALCAAGAWAENTESAENAQKTDSLFETLAGQDWVFSSGVGAWSTELKILADGSFTGKYHDSEMGETGEGYPDGTVYGCTFSGRLSLAGQADEYAWKLQVDSLALDEGQVKEAVEDGIRYVTAEPYGLSEGDEMLLHRPGTPVSALTEDQLFWSHVTEQDPQPEALETWLLTSERNESGFVGFPSWEASLPNPWQEMTAEQLQEASGLTFRVPEGAADVVYRWLPGERLAEMQFTLDGGEFCARLQPAELKDGELSNISGMYLFWENVEKIQVHHCRGTIGQARCGSEDWAELVLWYDQAPGVMGSLSVHTTEPDGLDLVAVAETVYLPPQGDA